MAAMMASQTAGTLSLLKFRLNGISRSEASGSGADCRRSPRENLPIDAKRISLTPGARIELERLTLPLPDDGGAAHREKPGLLFQRLARLETRGTKHRHCRAVFLVAHRFVAD